MENLIVISVVGIVLFFLARMLYFRWIQQSADVTWIETNVEIIKSEFSKRTYGNDLSYAKGESARRVKLTVNIVLNDGNSVVATQTVWTKTKNRAFFQEGKFVTILYAQDNPKKFKLKYDV
ncbi:hypothetical protein A5881_003419 [Enterococcus termitis]|nr:hypothetical protein A5881_003431 [Enterococcus termitis]